MEVDVGPWGGNGGSVWDDGRDVGGVKEIILEYSQYCIHSITVVYNDNGNSKGFRHGGHGGNGGVLRTKMSLDFPNEYLIGVAGFAADFNGIYVIRSLTFTTNKGKYRPMGVEGGDFFYWTAAEHGDGLHISSFSGRSGWYLDAIGFHLSPLANRSHANAHETREEDINVGPWGGRFGHDWNDGNHNGVREIHVSHGQYIEFIRVVYDSMGKDVVYQHGGEGHGSTSTVRLAFPEEFLTGISGYIGESNGYNVIRSLTFKSNRETYGPFGVEAGNPFHFSTERYCGEVRIVGFSGVSHTWMEAIGFNLCRSQQTQPPMTTQPSENEDICCRNCRLPKKKKMVMGPWGGKSGKGWDDGTYDGVREIRVAHDENCISSIYVVYDDNGRRVSCLHGGIGGRTRSKITLNYPDEFLTNISGFAGRVSGFLVLRSLTFKSNRRTFETLGIPNGEEFSSETEEYGNGFRITGFFGRSGFYIDEIGVHISPTQNLGGGIRQTMRQMVRNVGNVGRMACISPPQGGEDDTEAQTELVPTSSLG